MRYKWYNVSMAMKYTREQELAINTLDRSVLVSAAAGSGKTSILVQRILKIILEGKANVDELLVVTFTKAAAAEMKLRLASAIRKHMREHPEDAVRLREQLSRLYRAYITTIDSFALRVIREFFYEGEGDPDFKACDEVQGELMRREALAELFEAGYDDEHLLDIRIDIASTVHEADHGMTRQGASARGVNVYDTVCSESAARAVNRVGFSEFMRLYSEERQDETFKDKLLASYSGLRAVPDYFDWAYSRAELLKVTPETFEDSELQRIIAGDAACVLGRACSAADKMEAIFDEAGLHDMYEDKLAAEVQTLHDLRDDLSCVPASTGPAGRDARSIAASDASDADTGDCGLTLDWFERAAGLSFATLRATKAQKEAYEPIKEEIAALRKAYKDELKDLNSKYMAPDLAGRLAEMNETYRYTVYYIRMLEEFERRYNEKKRERRVMDFADMEHSAVRILRNKEAADVLRRRFKYIFVDEYQDTNRIQEELISSVARPDNVFRVGDIKQSIYRFRQAEPDIFKELYGRFSAPGSEDGAAIDLSMNFRSNAATIRYINHVFERIMDGYDDRAKLYPGPAADCGEYDFIPEVHILTTEEMEEDADAQGDQTEPAVAADAADEEVAELGKEEAEAEYIAALAADLIGTEFKDTKTGEIRKARASDIVILFRAVRVRGEIMSAALRRHGIEPHIEESDDYFDTVEIGVAMSLFSCIDNMKRDIPLISTLHSEVFGWTPAELAEVRIAHSEYLRRVGMAADEERTAEGHTSGAAAADDPDTAGAASAKPGSRRPAYYEAFRWYREDGPEGSLRDKARYAAGKLLEWRRLSHMMPLEDFIWHVLVDSGYYRMAGAMHGGARRQDNLRTLADRAARYSQESVASLSSYIRFVDVMRQKKISSSQNPAAAGDDVVRISTIHKSKGLEYPFVIVGGLGHRFMTDNNEKGFTFDPAIGAGLPYIDPARKYWRSTPVQRAINAKSRRDSYEEELRVLYVAMTRARNKLILTGTYESMEKLESYSARPECYLRVMQDVLKTGFNRYYIRPLQSGAGRSSRRSLNIPDPDSIVLTEDEQEIYREIDRRFSYEYPHKELLTAKAKYSVSELRRLSLEAETTAEADDSSSDAAAGQRRSNEKSGSASRRIRRASAADIGTGYHRIMEFIDFERAAASDAEAAAVEQSSAYCGEYTAAGAAGQSSAGAAYIRERADFLHDNGAIDDEVFREIDIDRIAEFFRTDIGIRAVRAALRGTLMKEKAFTLRTTLPAAQNGLDSDAEPRGDIAVTCAAGALETGYCESLGRQVLVQGVIDCCFEENGSMVLIDYKSSWIRPGKDHGAEIERIRHEYEMQIRLYSEAIHKGTGMKVSEAYLYLFQTGEAVQLI